jgi:hypothetical protein
MTKELLEISQRTEKRIDDATRALYSIVGVHQLPRAPPADGPKPRLAVHRALPKKEAPRASKMPISRRKKLAAKLAIEARTATELADRLTAEANAAAADNNNNNSDTTLAARAAEARREAEALSERAREWATIAAGSPSGARRGRKSGSSSASSSSSLAKTAAAAAAAATAATASAANAATSSSIAIATQPSARTNSPTTPTTTSTTKNVVAIGEESATDATATSTDAEASTSRSASLLSAVSRPHDQSLSALLSTRPSNSPLSKRLFMLV